MNTLEQPCPAIAPESGSPSILGLARCGQLSGWSWEMMVSSEKAVSILLLRHSQGAWAMLKEYDLIEWTCNISSELERLDSFITLVPTEQVQILHVDFSCWQVLFQWVLISIDSSVHRRALAGYLWSKVGEVKEREEGERQEGACETMERKKVHRTQWPPCWQQVRDDPWEAKETGENGEVEN